ncbi:zinc finger matrin-type protein 5 [Megalops cyprinoides]|uniref:zinc finger matrin-type protein 5 n=1 Tax=Megalops cyprinoides TaxID=118141 RepID=UPI0018642989|nr:zinc finger matrin-type protein 5 [Megalops cyprinoides]XP_036385710.1 zinc finger matrin-type protein 5 [Megalops cyprinoides]
MGKRYYCDYCDRSFQDNMHNRKKHLNGVQHHRAKKAWFHNFRDAAAILVEEQTKKPCRKFIQTGQCGFGTSCIFSHMTEKDMASLRQQIEDEKRRKEDPEEGAPCPERSVEEWLARREKRKEALRTGSLMEEEEEEDPSIDLPPHFISIPDLPPSLLPPPPGGWKGVPRTEWG